jgi:3-hydroxyacyl-CoA dehydrogenase
MAIKKVAVIGAGVMGAGIAAQLANAGLEVELLDRVDPKNEGDRTSIAKGAIEKMLKTKPAAFMHVKNARLVHPGNTEDDMGRIKDCDLIIEVVFENPKVKSDIFKKIDANRKPGAIIASNTSTIPLKDLIADQSDALKKDFVITHFFNPPRYMPLLELITSTHNSPEMIAELTRFMDEKMGKTVIPCNDTPGFIGNRIGTYWLQTAVNEAFSRNLTVEEADAVYGKPMGVPKSGIFDLIDVVGVNLMPDISKSLVAKLPADDAYVLGNKNYPLIDKMIADGYTGRKGKGGFYRLNDKREKLAIDLATGAERPAVKVKPASALFSKIGGLFKKKKKGASVLELDILNASKKGGLRAVFDHGDKYSDYAWTIFKKTVSYAAEHAHEISANASSVDDAMKLGYKWEKGPFEMLDAIGVDYFIKRLKAEGDKVPAFIEKAAGKTFYAAINGKPHFLQKDGSYAEIKRPDGVLLLSDVKLASKPVLKGKAASVWDIGDGVLCLEFTSKGNSLDNHTMKIINQTCDLIENSKGKYKALVVHNENPNIFSGGANLKKAAIALTLKQHWLVDKLVRDGQETYKRLKYASFPVISAPSGVAVGGGCEILLHSSHVQAHAELYVGLVEVGVGLLPAWGGSTELLTRALKAQAAHKLPGGPIPPVASVFETISTAKMATSAQEAKDAMYLRATDGITMNKARLLADAKAKAVEMAKDYKPEQPFDLKLPGATGLAALSLAVDAAYLKGLATPYDVVVSDKVARVLTGGDRADITMNVTQDYIRGLERQYFMALVHDSRTLARIKTMGASGKPLREKPIAGKKATALREEADRSLFARLFGIKDKAKKDFKNASVNDNKGLTRDTKPKVNWPKPQG